MNKGPSLDVVHDTLSGFTSDLHKLAQQIKEEKIEEKKDLLKKETEARHLKFQELQESVSKERQEAANAADEPSNGTGTN